MSRRRADDSVPWRRQSVKFGGRSCDIWDIQDGPYRITSVDRLQGCDAHSSVAVWHSPSYLQPTTAVLSPMLVSDDYVPQRAERALWRWHTAPSAMERLQLLDPDYGTVFHRTWKRQTCRTINSDGRKRHFCLDSGATVQCELRCLEITLLVLTYRPYQYQCLLCL